MNIGIYTSSSTLVDKLALRNHHKNTIATWQIRRFPLKISKSKEKIRIYFATEKFWRGYFILSDEVIFSWDDPEVISLMFDLKTWTDIEPVSVKQFRGFTYNTP